MKKEEVKQFNDEKTLLASFDADETSPYNEEMDFMEDPDEQKKIIEDIENYVQSTIMPQRSALGIENIWQDSLDLYDGVVDYRDFPHEDAHNLHIHITAMVCDILLEKAKKRTFTRPMMLMRAVPGKALNYNPSSIKRKEAWFDYRIHTDSDIEEDLDPIYMDAIKIGTGIAKECHVKDIKTVRELEVYDGSDRERKLAEIARFTEDFGDEKNNPDYKKNYNALMRGESIEVWVEKEEVVKYCPLTKWVDPFNLYIDCYIPLEYQRIIAEKIPDISWQELLSYFDSGIFKKEVKSGIIAKYPKEYRKMKYTIWEVEYVYRKGKGKNAKEIKTIVAYIKEYDELLCKGISFPYITRMTNYEIYRIKKWRNTNYGIGMGKLLKDTNIGVNDFVNLKLDEAEFDISPRIKAKRNTTFDPTTKSALGPAGVLWVDNMDDVMPFQRYPSSPEIYKVLEYMIRLTEWISGVTAYMSGRESPTDPNAPASKAYMLLQESNLRINAYIRNLDSSNKRLFYRKDRLYYQFFDESVKYYGQDNNGKYEEQDITRKELGIPVEYIPQLSDITINKAQEKEDNMKMAEFLLKMPMVANLPSAMRTIIEIQLRSAGGEWDKHIDVLLPDKKETDQIGKLVEILKEVGPEGVINLMNQLGAMPQTQTQQEPQDMLERT